MSRQSISREISDLESDIERAVETGMDGGPGQRHDGVLGNAIDAAKRKLKAEQKVWNGEVLEAFSTQLSGEYPKAWKIINKARHADVVDEGVAPAGKHGPFDAPPPPENLVPWVSDHMHYFTKYEDPRRAAEAVSKELFRNGIQGIHFTEVMLSYIEANGEEELETYVNEYLRIHQ